MNTLLIVSNVVLWCVMIIQMILFFAVTRSVSEMVKRFQVPQSGVSLNETAVVLGQNAPLFSEQDHRGEIVTLRRNAGHRTLLLFTLDTCVACQKLIPELPQLLPQEPSLRVIAVTQEDLSATDKQVPHGVSLIRCNWLMEQYDIKQTPYYVLIDSDGRIADKGVAVTINSLLDKTLDQTA
jgi:methylamine dehydrogenase accessory protein MauD